jgi:hypothetical protein
MIFMQVSEAEPGYTSNFWEYFNIIREHMPANCSADVQAAIALVDETFTSGNSTAIQVLKESFNMGGVSHLEDVASARTLNLHRR